MTEQAATKNEPPSRKRNLLLGVGALGFAAVGMLALEALAGRYFENKYPAGLDLVLPSFSHRTHTTAEFSYDVEINSLGFRDREFETKREGTYRILCIGDSLTYGWGVAMEEAWPKVLERELRAKGHDVEVANLGSPGGRPRSYAGVAARAIPILDPDLVLVAVVQGDDLRESVVPSTGKAKKSAAAQTPRSLFPNLGRIADVALEGRAGKDLTPGLEAGWERVVASLTPEQQERFWAIDSEMQAAFKEGGLNPDLVRASLKQPRYFCETMELESPLAQRLLENMSGELGRIRDSAKSHGTEVLVVSIPNGVYVSREAYETRGRLGFTVAEDMLHSTAPDDAIRDAASRAGLKFAELTQAFRAAAAESVLYYPFDGHLNPEGHELYGSGLVPEIERLMQ